MRLGEVTDLQAGAQLHLARERLELAEQTLEEGGLAAAIGADQGRAFAAAQLQVADGEQGVVGVADGDLVRRA